MKKTMRILSILITLTMILSLSVPIPAIAEGEVPVTINTPTQVEPDTSFTAYVDIGDVFELNTAQYDIWFDPTVLRLDSIGHGQIDGEMMVAMPNEIASGHWMVVNYPLIMTDNVTGSGYLAELNFHSIGDLGTGSDISITDGILSGITIEISASWTGDYVYIVAAGDANEDGVINVLDMTKVARIILQMDSPTAGADCNRDGAINVLDMTSIARKILGLE